MSYEHSYTGPSLTDIFKSQRPSGSLSEQEFVEKELLTLPGAFTDSYGNVFVDVGPGQSTTMFSCHTDTVHPKPHTNFQNNLQVDIDKNHVFTDGTSQLGADDGTGIWFMLNMIEHGVPGLYAFHRDEECGGLGSQASAHENALMLEIGNIDRCVAFDRHYYTDVITHQGTRCCSDAFAQALSDELNITPAFEFKPSPDGVFTDSANYTHLIPECTNLSVGYWSQHTIRETQDIGFAEAMLIRLLQVDWESLPTERSVDDHEYNDDGFSYFDDWDGGLPKSRPVETQYEKDLLTTMSIEDIVECYPVEVAEILQQYGYSADILRFEVMKNMRLYG